LADILRAREEIECAAARLRAMPSAERTLAQSNVTVAGETVETPT
jgi:hypothetical protein